jgi:protein-S-isoprenylcysteine O-methyltransferase Ste14
MWPLFKTLLFTVLVPGTLAVYVPLFVLRPPGASVGRPWGWLGTVPMAVGAAIYLRCAWEFATAGQGTPAPIDAPRFLVRGTLYRWVRNPMYVGVVTLVLGEGLTFYSWTIVEYALAGWLCFHLFVVFYEEPTLRAKFGGPYEDYRKRVPRWIPRKPR